MNEVLLASIVERAHVEIREVGISMEENMQLKKEEVQENNEPAYGLGLQGTPPRIVLAEDDDDLRVLIGSALRMDGYQVIEARDGGELLDVIADWLVYRWPEEPVDLILSDVRMPGYSGMEVLAGLRKAHWETPVILITAHGNANMRDEAAQLGANAVLGKPFDLDDLRTAVLHVVSRGRPQLSRKLWWKRGEVFDNIDREFVGQMREPAEKIDFGKIIAQSESGRPKDVERVDFRTRRPKL
jgi:two-component system response regulator (stage 0 sporulation protein F)